MTGCRVGAKNTLVKNYLYLAEKDGAKVIPLTTVSAISPLNAGGYEVSIKKTGTTSRRFRHKLTAAQVVLAAGDLGHAEPAPRHARHRQAAEALAASR